MTSVASLDARGDPRRSVCPQALISFVHSHQYLRDYPDPTDLKPEQKQVNLPSHCVGC